MSTCTWGMWHVVTHIEETHTEPGKKTLKARGGGGGAFEAPHFRDLPFASKLLLGTNLKCIVNSYLYVSCMIKEFLLTCHMPIWHTVSFYGAWYHFPFIKNETGHGPKAAALWPNTTYTKFGVGENSKNNDGHYMHVTCMCARVRASPHAFLWRYVSKFCIGGVWP